MHYGYFSDVSSRLRRSTSGVVVWEATAGMGLCERVVGVGARVEVGGAVGRRGARLGVVVEDVDVRDATSVRLVLVQLRQQRRAPRLQLRVAPRRRSFFLVLLVFLLLGLVRQFMCFTLLRAARSATL